MAHTFVFTGTTIRRGNGDDQHILLTTSLGPVKIELFPESAPMTVEWINSAVVATSDSLSEGMTFYRAESVQDGHGLVQGRFGYSPPVPRLPLESASIENLEGCACLIGGTSDFFISLKNHREWDGAFTVFGRVVSKQGSEGRESLVVLNEITKNPVEVVTHPTYGTKMRMLVEPVSFRVTSSNGGVKA